MQRGGRGGGEERDVGEEGGMVSQKWGVSSAGLRGDATCENGERGCSKRESVLLCVPEERLQERK